MVKSIPSISAPPADADTGAGGVEERQFIADLFTKYRSSVHRYLCRLVHAEDAAELVQETYFRLLRQGLSTRLEAPARAFLFHAATNIARDFRRRGRSRHVASHVSIDEVDEPAANVTPEDLISNAQTLDHLQATIAALPEEMRTIFLLHRYRDLSFEQIAAVLRISRRTVARKMKQAITLLGDAIGEEL